MFLFRHVYFQHITILKDPYYYLLFFLVVFSLNSSVDTQWCGLIEPAARQNSQKAGLHELRIASVTQI